MGITIYKGFPEKLIGKSFNIQNETQRDWVKEYFEKIGFDLYYDTKCLTRVGIHRINDTIYFEYHRITGRYSESRTTSDLYALDKITYEEFRDLSTDPISGFHKKLINDEFTEDQIKEIMDYKLNLDRYD